MKEREVYENINGHYDSSKCKWKTYIVNSVGLARYLCYDGKFKGKVEADEDYPNVPRFIFFFPSSIQLEEFASHYDEFKSIHKKM